jgi:hypothetical protein
VKKRKKRGYMVCTGNYVAAAAAFNVARPRSAVPCLADTRTTKR